MQRLSRRDDQGSQTNHREGHRRAFVEFIHNVPFYGAAAPVEDVPKIKAALLIHYAENDERINAMRPEFEAALKEHGVRYTMHTYPGTNPGFHNNSTPRYDEAAAKLAWERTLAFFEEHLREA